MNDIPAPGWLLSKIDQRVARLEDEGRDALSAFASVAAGIVMTPLTEPEDWGVSVEKWERTCDNCGLFTPEGKEFYTGNDMRTLRSGPPIIITFGMCEKCKSLP